jgi:hypothetical protein
MQPGPRGTGGHGRALLAIVALSTLARLLAARFIPLLDDEAHYWVWSRHLMWGYPDHPPMIAGLVALGTRLAGDTVLGVRLMPLLYGTASTLVIYGLAARLFSARAGLRAALLFQALPALAAGGVMAAPDAALGLYWLLAMLWGWMAIVEGVGWAWPAAGAMAGLVVQSKLAGGALLVSLAGIVLATRAYRRWLLRPGPYLAVLAGGLVMAPLVGWNLTHDWATIRRALVIDPWVHPVGALGNVAALVGSQFLYYAPLGFPVALAGLIASVRARRDERFRFLWWCAAPTLLIVLFGSIRALSKPHYTGPALLSGIIAAAALWPRWRAQRLLRAGVATSAALTVLAFVAAAVPNPLLGEFHQQTRAWPRVAREIERLLPTLGPPGEVFLLAETYQGGSQIAFATGNRIPVVVPFRGFDLWEPPARWIGRNGVLLDHLGGEISTALAATFARVEGPHVVPVGPGAEVRLYLGVGFLGLGASRR